VLGLGAIAIGWRVASTGAAANYFAGVLANVGTTLLLVGVVLLLERRIIDNATRLVRSANDRTNEAIRAQIRDLEDRMAAEWKSVTPENLAEKKAETARLTDEFTKRIVEETTGDE
jgi:predicted phage tail protein